MCWQWPTYHFFNNVTRGPACYCSPAPCTCPQPQHPSAELVMEPLNDANVPHPPTTTPRAALVPAADARPPLQAIFEFKGLFHVMMQAGGGNWTHGVSSSAAGPWFTESVARPRHQIPIPLGQPRRALRRNCQLPQPRPRPVQWQHPRHHVRARLRPRSEPTAAAIARAGRARRRAARRAGAAEGPVRPHASGLGEADARPRGV